VTKLLTWLDEHILHHRSPKLCQYIAYRELLAKGDADAVNVRAAIKHQAWFYWR